ncbi:MAG: response regulator transcription factor [Bacteroidota bacterium]
MKTPVRCIIIDDEPLAIRLLKTHAEQVPELEVVASFENPLEALSFLRKEQVDLIFLDIQMPMLTGLDFVRSLTSSPAIIFTTAYRDYAVESYELAVVDYLLKPITFTRFYRAVNKYLDGRMVARTEPTNLLRTATDSAGNTYRFFNVNKKQIKVKLTDITYIESLKDYLRIRTIDGELVTKLKISELAEELPANFLRVHRSFLINLHHLSAYTAHNLEIGSTSIPIGASYKSEVIRHFSQL